MSEVSKVDLALALADKNRRPYKKNGQWVNLPAITPNGKLLVIDRESGTLVALDRPKDFNPKIHKRWNKSDGTPKNRFHDFETADYLSPVEARQMQEDRKREELDAVVNGPKNEPVKEEKEEAPVDEEVEAEGSDEAMKRFLELKEIGFKNLKGEDRKEYQDLLKVYGV